jgi:hypothetical protein
MNDIASAWFQVQFLNNDSACQLLASGRVLVPYLTTQVANSA